MKRCPKCLVDKAVSEFYINGKTGKPSSPCKVCARRAAAERRERIADQLPAQQRGYDLKRRYGISPEDYARLLEQQGGLCAICSGPPGGRARYFHVDHCHDTGQVRGLLCSGCNRGLGYLCDDPATLLAAAAYLEEETSG